MNRRLISTAVSVVAMLALSLTAVGSAGAATTKGSGTLNGHGKTIVVFFVATTDVYINADVIAVKAEAKKLNYKVNIILNNFDQNQEDQQVRQYLSTGQKPAAFIYWPATDAAGINSSRLLSKVAPVFQIDQGVLPQAKPYVTAYVGANQYSIGEEAGFMALKSLKAEKKAGVKFHGPNGKPNILNISFPPGYQAGISRMEGFYKIVGKSFNVLATEYAPTTDAAGGLTAAGQIIPKFKSEGIDYVFAGSNAIGGGVVTALKQNGIVSGGKGTTIISGDFSGNKLPLEKGQIYSAVLQSPVIEGGLTVQTVARFLATGQVKAGTVTIPFDHKAPVVSLTPPATTTYMPNPPILQSNYKNFVFWGLGINKLEF